MVRVRAGAPDIWAGVDRLIDRADSLHGLRAHRLHLLAARRWRALGREVPPELRLEERASAVSSISVQALVRRIRDAVDGPLVVIKGPEVAARYPDPTLRPYSDLDLLVPDTGKAQSALLSAGFTLVGDPQLYEDLHHARPLAIPGVPIPVELHSAPKWPDGFAAPPLHELLEAAVPSATGVAGVSTLAPAHHALVLAAHSWAHQPLRRVHELVDVAAIGEGVDPAELRALARRWGVRRIWDTTAAAADALVAGGRTTLPMRTWARHLPRVREQTVLEFHLERWFSAFWESSAPVALARVPGTLVGELLPAPGETAAAKLSRSRQALANARVPQPRHAEQMERAGILAPLFHELKRRKANNGRR